MVDKGQKRRYNNSEMIRHVRIKGYKSLKDIDVRLQPLTVIFGPNATGKSNLFDALGLLSRMVTKRSLNEAFNEHRGTPLEAFYCGDRGIEGLLKGETAQFTIEVDVELSEEVRNTIKERIRNMRKGIPGTRERGIEIEKFLRYLLTIEIVTATGDLRVVNEQLIAIKKDGTLKKSRAPFIEKVGNELRVRMEGQAGRPISPEIGANYTLVAYSSSYPPHYPHISAFQEELSRWQFYYFDPRSMMRAESPLKSVKNIGQFGEDLAAFYNSLKADNPNQFKAINLALRRLLPTIQNLDIKTHTDKGILELSIMEDDVRFSARLISEGTLRILGLLAITNSSTTVIGYEEPENGVHPRRLKLIADLFRNFVEAGRGQVIINTHSPIFPDYFVGDNCLVVCRKEGTKTIFEEFSSIGPLFQKREIEKALEETTLQERIIRGDFGG